MEKWYNRLTENGKNKLDNTSRSNNIEFPLSVSSSISDTLPSSTSGENNSPFAEENRLDFELAEDCGSNNSDGEIICDENDCFQGFQKHVENTHYTEQVRNINERNDRKGYDKNFILEAVKEDGFSLQYASEEFRNDKEVVLEAVKQHGWSLEYASEELRNDKEVVLEAVKQNGKSLYYANLELGNDKEFVLEAVKLNGLSLEYSSEELKNDKEVVIEAVKQNGYSLQIASKELQNDKEIVLEAVKKNGISLQFSGEELRNDREIVLEAVKQNGESLQFSSEELRNEREILLEVVKRDVRCLRYSSDIEGLSRDKDFFLEASKQNSASLEFASLQLRTDREFVLEAVKQNAASLEYASEILKNDREIVLETVKQDGWLIHFASEHLRDDKQIVLHAIRQKKGFPLQFASERLKNDQEVVLEAIRVNEISFKVTLSKKIRDKYLKDRLFLLEAVKRNSKAFNLANEEQKKDKEFVLEAVSKNGIALKFLNYKDLRNDKEIVLEAVRQNGNSLEFVNKELKNDKEVVLEAVKQNENSLQYASLDLKDDKEVVLEAVRKNGISLFFASNKLKNDPDIVQEAIKTNIKAYKNVGEEIKKESSFLKKLVEYEGDIERCFEELFSSVSEEEKRMKNWKEVFQRHLCNVNDEQNEMVFNEETVIHQKRTVEEKYYIKELEMKMKTVKFSDLEIYRNLGRGAYGVTYLCRVSDLDGIFVIKIYKEPGMMNQKKLEKVISRDCLSIPYHQNVVPILRHSENEIIDLQKLPDYEKYWKSSEFLINKQEPLAKCGMILMKYHRKDLNVFMKKRRETGFGLEIVEICRILKGIIEGACHLHNNMIVHRDLHFGNIFVDGRYGRVWIGDFGCALDLRSSEKNNKFLVPVNDEVLYSFASSCSYKVGGYSNMLPPEITRFMEKEYRDGEEEEFLNYEKSDIYSVGMIGLILLNDVKTDILEKVVDDFVKKLVDKDMKKRFGCCDAKFEIKKIMKNIKEKKTVEETEGEEEEEEKGQDDENNNNNINNNNNNNNTPNNNNNISNDDDEDDDEIISLDEPVLLSNTLPGSKLESSEVLVILEMNSFRGERCPYNKEVLLKIDSIYESKKEENKNNRRNNFAFIFSGKEDFELIVRFEDLDFTKAQFNRRNLQISIPDVQKNVLKYRFLGGKYFPQYKHHENLIIVISCPETVLSSHQDINFFVPKPSIFGFIKPIFSWFGTRKQNNNIPIIEEKDDDKEFSQVIKFEKICNKIIQLNRKRTGVKYSHEKVSDLLKNKFRSLWNHRHLTLDLMSFFASGFDFEEHIRRLSLEFRSKLAEGKKMRQHVGFGVFNKLLIEFNELKKIELEKVDFKIFKLFFKLRNKGGGGGKNIYLQKIFNDEFEFKKEDERLELIRIHLRRLIEEKNKKTGDDFFSLSIKKIYSVVVSQQLPLSLKRRKRETIRKHYLNNDNNNNNTGYWYCPPEDIDERLLYPSSINILEDLCEEEEEEEEEREEKDNNISSSNDVSIQEKEEEDNRFIVGSEHYGLALSNIRLDWMDNGFVRIVGNWVDNKQFHELCALSVDCPAIYNIDSFIRLIEVLARAIIMYNEDGQYINNNDRESSSENNIHQKSSFQFVEDFLKKLFQSSPQFLTQQEYFKNTSKKILKNLEELKEHKELKEFLKPSVLDKLSSLKYSVLKLLPYKDDLKGLEKVVEEFPELMEKKDLVLDDHKKVIRLYMVLNKNIDNFKCRCQDIFEILKGHCRAFHMKYPNHEVPSVYCFLNDREIAWME